MKTSTLALVASAALAMAMPAFSDDGTSPQNGDLSYSGNFLIWKDAGHRLVLTTDAFQRVFVSQIRPDGWMGLHSSDQIERIDGQPAHWVGQLVGEMKNHAPSPVVLTVNHHDIDMRIYQRRDLQFARVDYAKFIPKS